MGRYSSWAVGVLVLGLSLAAAAGEVAIVQAKFTYRGANLWSVAATLRHGDTGWQHYANAWRVETAAGKVLGTRTLWHPHVAEQPFTRGLDGIEIPPALQQVFVAARDTVHGWSSDRVRVDLGAPSGDRFEVNR